MDSENLEIIMVALAPPPGIERAVEAIENARAFPVSQGAPRLPELRREIDAAETLLPAFAQSAPPPGGLTLSAVADARADPARTIGRITAYFDGKVRWCTGTVVAEQIVLTAAHCLYQRASADGKPARFADWLSFEPGYHDGASEGVWTGEKLYFQRGWMKPAPGTNSGPHDVALVRLDRAVADVTGTAQLLETAPASGDVTAFGYPRKPSFGHDWNGERLFASTGALMKSEQDTTLKARNGLTEGSSGGPWFVKVNEAWKLAGVNSMKPVDADDTTWSPRLDTGFLSLLDAALADTRAD